MEAGSTEALLAHLGRRLGGRVVLWRGGELTGSDLDLLVLEGAERELSELLAAEGLRPRPADRGHTVWVGGDLPVDVLSASAWPRSYPALQSFLGRVRPVESGPPEASPEDRLLILAAEAVAGRPIQRIALARRGCSSFPGWWTVFEWPRRRKDWRTLPPWSSGRSASRR